MSIRWETLGLDEAEEGRLIKSHLESLSEEEAGGPEIKQLLELFSQDAAVGADLNCVNSNEIKEQRERVPESDGSASLPQVLRLLLVKNKIAGFEQIVVRYGKVFHQIAWGVLYNYELAQDVVSEAYMKIYGWLESVKAEEILQIDLLPYLCRVVLNVALTRLKQERQQRLRMNRRGQLLLIEQRLLMTVDESLEQDEKFRILHEEINRLPAKYRQAIQLRYFLDEECLKGSIDITSERYTRLSAKLGVNETTLRSWVGRAKRRLRRQLAERGVDAG